MWVLTPGSPPEQRLSSQSAAWSTMARRLQDELAAFFFEYDTPRMVLVRNKKVGVVFRLIQLVVLVYVIG